MSEALEVQAVQEATVTRTFRAAIRVGEDFLTLEETVHLPVTATEEEIAQAVAFGQRIYQAQRAAAEAQIQQLRAAKPVKAGEQTPAPVAPPAPAPVAPPAPAVRATPTRPGPSYRSRVPPVDTSVTRDIDIAF